MPNSFKVLDRLKAPVGAGFYDGLSFARSIKHTFDSNSEAQGGIKEGQWMRIMKPQRTTTTVGKVATATDVVQLEETLVTSIQRHNMISLSSVEILQNWSNAEGTATEYGKKLGVDMDADLFGRAINQTPNVVLATGTSGTSLSKADIQRARSLIAVSDCDMMDMRFYVDPLDMGSFVDNTSTLFNPTQSIAQQYLRGYEGRAVGAEWFEFNRNPNISIGFTAGGSVVADIVGAMASAVTVQGSTALSVSGFGANLQVEAGTILTIAGCNRVKPATGFDTGLLAQFRVTTTVSLDGAGAGTLIVDPIYSTGAYRNVTALPANTAVVTILGTAGKIYRQSLMFHPDAYIAGSGRLPDTTDGGAPARFGQIDGFDYRINRQHDIASDDTRTRMDVLYGITGYTREWSCKIWVPIN
jgi:hypothetical protein